MGPPASRASKADWFENCGVRLGTLWLWKFLGITAGMTLFFTAYFWLLQNPIHPPTVMPLTAVDRWVGFHSGALPLYLSLWVYVSLPPGLIADRRELISYGVAAYGLGAVGLVIFLLWPTSVPPANTDWLGHSAFSFLKSADAAGNACPSLHVAFAAFTAIELQRLLRVTQAGLFVRVLNWLWCSGILYSTIATRQHVFVDLLAGGVFGAITAGFHLRYLGRIVPGLPTIR
jgi:membrane-associated phospholipid phosphatase